MFLGYPPALVWIVLNPRGHQLCFSHRPRVSAKRHPKQVTSSISILKLVVRCLDIAVNGRNAAPSHLNSNGMLLFHATLAALGRHSSRQCYRYINNGVSNLVQYSTTTEIHNQTTWIRHFGTTAIDTGLQESRKIRQILKVGRRQLGSTAVPNMMMRPPPNIQEPCKDDRTLQFGPGTTGVVIFFYTGILSAVGRNQGLFPEAETPMISTSTCQGLWEETRYIPARSRQDRERV